MSGAGVLAALLLIPWVLVRGELIVTRRHPVDTFSLKDSCGGGGCIGASMGTALMISPDGCTCACASHLPAFRQDLQICVDDLHDCPLIPFVSGTTYQKIPYVYLPLKGQIIYPSAELVFAGAESPVCVVSTSKFLVTSGWEELKNKSESEPTFRLFRDEGRTFLQWLGEGDLRHKLEGRLVLIHLKCRDQIDEQNPDNNIFTSCVSFRVAGTPSDMNSNVGIKEVAFSVDTEQNSDNGGSSYIITAVCSILLGLIYIVSVLLYLQGKKKKRKYSENNNSPLTVAEEGIVKNNPLLRHCHENVAYLSDPPSGSDSDDGVESGSVKEDIRKVQTTSALIHPCMVEKDKKNKENPYQFQDSSNIERLPEENVSIVETPDFREERPETVRAIACSNGRKKLYFNPAYFEPELLMAPPPAAIEFLTKIREVISIAKTKMEAKRFLPSLMGIPEENDYVTPRTPSIAGTESTVIMRTDYNTIQRKRDQLKYENHTDQGYHICCGNLEQKQTSIQKWLENIPLTKSEDESSNASTISKISTITKKRQAPGIQLVQKVSEIESEKLNSLYENNEVTMEKKTTHKQSKHKYQEPFREGVSIDIEGLSRSQIKKSKKPSLPIPESDSNKSSLNSARQHPSCHNVSKRETNMKTKLPESNKHATEKELINKNSTKVKSTWKDLFNEDNSTISSNKDIFIKHEIVDNNKAYLMNKINSALTSKLADKNVNNNKYENDHDYETIILQKQEETQSLPDFVGRPNGYSLVSEVYVNDQLDNNSESSRSNFSSINSNESDGDNELEYDRNSRGHLTIKVKDTPVNYANDSDDFEPDTLDRKPNKLKINQETSISIEKNQDIFADSLERPPHISLKSTGTFKSEIPWNNFETHQNIIKHPLNRAFGSLREIFEAKTKFNHCSHSKSIKSSNHLGSTQSLNNETEVPTKSWRRGKPKLLSPEAKQARRQRDPSPPNHLILKPPVTSTSEHLPNVPPLKKESGPPLPPRLQKPPLPPKNGSVKNTNNEIQHTNPTIVNGKSQRPLDVGSESSEYEPLSSQECCYQSHTAPSGVEPERAFQCHGQRTMSHMRNIRHLQNRTEDSGYLSTDSNGSDVIKQDDSVSETDDSFFDGASESGAESIATDSFFFGKGVKSFRAHSTSDSPTDF